jgi:hypothetical protein
MTVTRIVLGGLGVAAAAYGTVTLLGLGLDNLRAASVWIVGGVLVHDAVLAPATVAVAAAAARLSGDRRLPGPLVVGSVLLGSVTVVAVPVLGRFGARTDNPTLLDRNYVLGWLALATLVAAGVAIAMIRQRRGTPARGGDRGEGAGRR